MSMYHTYRRDIMEVVRMLTVEELMMIVADLAVKLELDHLRDTSYASVLADVNEVDVSPHVGYRPRAYSWRALTHAMRTAGLDVPDNEDEAHIEEVTTTLGLPVDESAAILEHLFESEDEYAAMFTEVGRIMDDDEGLTFADAYDRYVNGPGGGPTTNDRGGFAWS